MKFTILLLFTVLLSGCATKTPTDTIIDQHIQLADAAIATQTVTIEDLKTCRAGLLSAKESPQAELKTYKADIRYWKAVSSFLVILIILGIVYKIMKR